MDIARDFFGVDPKSLAIIMFIWFVISLWLFGYHEITPGIVLIGTFVTIWLLKQLGLLLFTIIAVIVFGGFVFLAFLAKLGRKSSAPPQPYKPPVSSTLFRKLFNPSTISDQAKPKKLFHGTPPQTSTPPTNSTPFGTLFNSNINTSQGAPSRIYHGTPPQPVTPPNSSVPFGAQFNPVINIGQGAPSRIYHGTPSLSSAEDIVLNNRWLHRKAFPNGIYMSEDFGTAAGFAGSSGAVVEVDVSIPASMIVEMTEMPGDSSHTLERGYRLIHSGNVYIAPIPETSNLGEYFRIEGLNPVRLLDDRGNPISTRTI